MLVSRIPVSAAKRIADGYGQRQVIVVTWDGGQTNVVTYGVTLSECEQAALGGNLVKRALGWPEDACHDMPRSRRKRGRDAT